MKKISVLIVLICYAFYASATGEPSTRFNIYVPPNNDPVHRDVCLVITAIYDSTAFTIVDDSLDGDNDDTKTGILMAGQSYVLYIRDNGINDDAQYASGGVLKQDGDYFRISSDKLVFASQSTNSDWQHDWVPSVNKSSIGEKFIIYAPKNSTSNRDLNVFAYSDSTFVTVRKISASPTTSSGFTNIAPNGGTIVLQRMLNRGQDLIYTYTDARDLMKSGETYQLECSKPSTVQYGALWGNERDGGGYVPTSNGSSSGDLLYFAVPFQSGTTGEQEIRIVSWDDNNAVTLERYSAGAWLPVKSWTVSRLKAVDWVGRNNGNVNYSTVFRVSCAAGKKVSVFEGNWFETGSPGTSDMATMVASEAGNTSGQRFLTYMAPPGNEQNVRNPFTGNLFGQKLTHAYLFAGADSVHVTVKDAYTNGTKLSRSYVIAPYRYVDCYLTQTEWQSIYNGTGTTSGAERPYLLIESDNNISVMNSNFNDNWMMYFGTSQEQSFDMNSSSTQDYTKPGDTVTITTAIVLNTTQPVTDVSVEVLAQGGLQVVSSTFNDATANTRIDGQITQANGSTTVEFANLPVLQPTGVYTVQTTVVTQVADNTGSLVPNNSVLNVETITTGTVEGVVQQSVATESITVNSSNTSAMMFSAYTSNTFSDTTDSWTCSCVDANNDGYDDILFTERNKTKANWFYVNTRNGGFTKQVNGSLLQDKGQTVSNTWADADNDGDIDLLTVNDTYNPNVLHLNNGSAVFTRAQTGEMNTAVSYYHGASWVDYDNDGYADVYICNYMATRFNELYHNEGNGSFRKVNDGVLSKVNSETVGATWADYDNDGLQDLFIPDNRQGKNRLFRNNGNGTFTENHSTAPVLDGGYSVGGCWGDIDNDGDLDLFVSNASDRDNYFYLNNGNGTFTKDVSSVITRDGGHSHGCSFADVDNDADLDLYVTNDKGFKFLYLNDGAGNFVKKTNELVTANYGNAFGTSWCDFDHDGDLDLFVATHSNQPNKLFVNNTSSGNWIQISLVGTVSNKSALGTRVHVKCNGKWQMREVNSQSGFGGQNSYRQHFGLGNATIIDSVKIVWSSGTTDYYTHVNVNQFNTYTESNTQKVTGVVFNDLNGDCLKDSNEHGIFNAEVTVAGYTAITGEDGKFCFRLKPGVYPLTLKQSPQLTPSVCAIIPVTVSSSPVTGLTLAASVPCSLPDALVDMGTTLLRRGFKNQLKIDIHNAGLQGTGAYTLVCKTESSVVIKSASVAWNAQGALTQNGKSYNTYTWNLPDLEAGARMSLVLTDSVKVNAQLGSFVNLVAEISGIQSECNLLNNTVSVTEKIVGAVDPNDKYVYPKGAIKAEETLTYRISFQNVGNYPASRVVITDILSDVFDSGSIRLLASSHPAYFSLEGNTMTWQMEDINLPDSISDPAGSEGYVTFSIRLVKGLDAGTRILNKASIVFDYNDPVLTSTTSNVIEDRKKMPYSAVVYPNPASDYFNVYLQGNSDKEFVQRLSVYTVTGIKISEKIYEDNRVPEYPAEGITPGVYILYIDISDGVTLRHKLVIE